MKKWTTEQLVSKGYTIKNAQITGVSLNMKNHGCLTLDLTLKGDGWGCVYGGRVLGNGYVGAKEFTGSEQGMVAIMRIMDTVGVDDLFALKGEYVRVPTKGIGAKVDIIGNIINDKWFDYGSFFETEGNS